jgi:hypothetical protein
MLVKLARRRSHEIRVQRWHCAASSPGYMSPTSSGPVETEMLARGSMLARRLLVESALDTQGTTSQSAELEPIAVHRDDADFTVALEIADP